MNKMIKPVNEQDEGWTKVDSRKNRKGKSQNVCPRAETVPEPDALDELIVMCLEHYNLGYFLYQSYL